MSGKEKVIRGKYPTGRGGAAEKVRRIIADDNHASPEQVVLDYYEDKGGILPWLLGKRTADVIAHIVK